MLSIFRKEDDIQNKCYKLNSLLDSIKSSNNPSYSTQKKNNRKYCINNAFFCII